MTIKYRHAHKRHHFSDPSISQLKIPHFISATPTLQPIGLGVNPKETRKETNTSQEKSTEEMKNPDHNTVTCKINEDKGAAVNSKSENSVEQSAQKESKSQNEPSSSNKLGEDGNKKPDCANSDSVLKNDNVNNTVNKNEVGPQVTSDKPICVNNSEKSLGISDDSKRTDSNVNNAGSENLEDGLAGNK